MPHVEPECLLVPSFLFCEVEAFLSELSESVSSVSLAVSSADREGPPVLFKLEATGAVVALEGAALGLLDEAGTEADNCRLSCPTVLPCRLEEPEVDSLPVPIASLRTR